MKRLNKVWKEHEKYQLWVGYHTKTPLLVMEAYFGRTMSSINKYLARSGIRDQIRNTDYANKNQAIHTLKDFKTLIIHLGLDKDTVGTERQTTRNWQPSPMTIEKLKYLGLTMVCPWVPNQRALNLPKTSRIGRTSKKNPWHYVSMSTVVNFLIRSGADVKGYPHKNAYGWTYTMNSTPITPHRLLGQANILRGRNNETRFLVEGITYD